MTKDPERSWEQFGLGVISGEDRRWRASVLRAVLRGAEPAYATLMRARNALYDRGILAKHELGRAAVSVGNLTAGGTGKTPFVRWLATRLRDEGIVPAVLLRGYRSAGAGGFSDEAEMLRQQTRAIVACGADRVATAARALAEHPEVNLFVLDDAFQHRRAARDLDIVLVNAADPFGYGHVHPRGLLREPLHGLSRAHAVVLTHADEADALDEIRRQVRAHNPAAPIYAARHALVGLRSAQQSATEPPDIPIDELSRRRFYFASGIGSPQSVLRQFATYAATFAGHRTFDDHHLYSEQTLELLRRQAKQTGATVIVVTEKDWVKIARLQSAVDADSVPFLRLEMDLRFLNSANEQAMLNQVRRAIRSRASQATQVTTTTTTKKMVV